MSDRIAWPVETQLPLDLRVARADSPGAPHRSASNAAALDLIAAWPRWPYRWLCLAGPPGSGKSRIARHWAHAADAPVVTAAELAEIDPVTLAGEAAVVLEDVDRARPDEALLFHFLNAATAAGGDVLLTARERPVGWPVATPDLASRLATVPTVLLAPPDDELIRQVFATGFAERQLVVDPSVIDYLLIRMERSLHEAVALVERLDRHGLARQRRITRWFATEVLAAQPAAPGEPD